MSPEQRQRGRSPERGARQRLRLVGAEEEDGVLVRWGFHGAVRDVIDLKGNPKQEGGQRERLEHVPLRGMSAPASSVGLRHPRPLGGKHSKKAPGWSPKAPAAALGPGRISSRVTEGIQHGCSMARARREVVSPLPGSMPGERGGLVLLPRDPSHKLPWGGAMPEGSPLQPGLGGDGFNGSFLAGNRPQEKPPPPARRVGPPCVFFLCAGSSARLSVSWLHVVRAAGRATSGSLGVRRGCPACWGGLRGKRGAFPKSASKLKQAGLQLAAARGLSWKDWPGQPRQRRDRWQGRHPRSHGVAQPSIVVSGTRSLPGTCWPQSHTVSTCQALPIRHLQQMNLPPGTTAMPPPNPRATSRTPAQLCLFLQAFSQHRHGSALSPSQRDLPSLATHTPPSQPRPPNCTSTLRF